MVLDSSLVYGSGENSMFGTGLGLWLENLLFLKKMISLRDGDVAVILESVENGDDVQFFIPIKDWVE